MQHASEAHRWIRKSDFMPTPIQSKKLADMRSGLEAARTWLVASSKTCTKIRGTSPADTSYLALDGVLEFQRSRRAQPGGKNIMDEITGLAAVIMIFGMPTAILGMYTYYRVRKLRTEERMAAIQRGVAVGLEAGLSGGAQSHRSRIRAISLASYNMFAFLLTPR